jgi:hypothetical protein
MRRTIIWPANAEDEVLGQAQSVEGWVGKLGLTDLEVALLGGVRSFWAITVCSLACLFGAFRVVSRRAILRRPIRSSIATLALAEIVILLARPCFEQSTPRTGSRSERNRVPSLLW